MKYAIAGLVILAISLAGAVLLGKRKTAGQERQTRILVTGLYFWVLTFVQLIVVAIVYAVLMH